MARPAIFVDRDGTLIEEVNFLSRVEDLIVFPFTPPSLRKLKELGYHIIVLTNQSGIGRGLYTEADMHRVHDEIDRITGGLIDRFYFCPHLPDAGCRCRKPELAMIESAMNDLDIDLSRSWMIGDKDLDVLIAANAAISSAMVMTGYGPKHLQTLQVSPTIVADDLGQAIDALIEHERSRGALP